MTRGSRKYLYLRVTRYTRGERWGTAVLNFHRKAANKDMKHSQRKKNPVPSQERGIAQRRALNTGCGWACLSNLVEKIRDIVQPGGPRVVKGRGDSVIRMGGGIFRIFHRASPAGRKLSLAHTAHQRARESKHRLTQFIYASGYSGSERR